MLDQTFDRLQKLVSQLELLNEKLSQEDVNQKLLRSLSPEWNTHAVVWRNKADFNTMSMDDLYNNLKVYELEVKGMSSSSSSTQNMAFFNSSACLRITILVARIVEFSEIHHPQATDTELLQARENLMEAIEAFLKEYDHIAPNEKCMALLLTEERFLKIKQVMEKEQNQPEVMQELLLKLMNDLQVLKGIQQEKEKPTAQSFTPFEIFSIINDVEVFMKDIYTFLRKFSRIPFGVTPKVLLVAWERFSEIKDALTDKKYRQEDIQEFWNCPTILFDDDDEYTIIYSKPKAITPDLPIEEPDNSLSMGDEHLSTIPEMESDELIKSSVSNLVQSRKFNIGDTSSDDNDFEDIEYVSLEEVNDVDQEEKEFDLIDIVQIQRHDEICLNVEPDTAMINNFDTLNEDECFDSGGGYPDFEDSRAHGFVHSYIRASYPQLH
ncbi:hypothetical protein Tco_1068835 [Tanacetum coccineum]|uniref:Uncharacterized protein n=1 Tax=Tanacetum coccineum TaxID=301880 RepID=A0ABQ5HGS7_9ASTR